MDLYIFDSLSEVRQCTEESIREYNEERPHSSLGNLTPVEFAIHSGQLPGMDGLERRRELIQART
ncbi:hypothetical protein PSDVSF_13390 [Pseudodesulfovibrio sediminis]|uniref:Integrase catalytic domain-containing protein n=1 Tax=Pseudodesulfovibrio sediminis TaxID=2810563 RepID=A0ABM7P364_9BACT|nr:hypothetical protein PSDVSF_13390 [Pseudodesulfovibrio sediminis]